MKGRDATAGVPEDDRQPRTLHLAGLSLEMKRKAGHPQTDTHEQARCQETGPPGTLGRSFRLKCEDTDQRHRAFW